MVMQWLESELRKGRIPGDLERADDLKRMLQERGKDIPSSQSPRIPHGDAGKRKWVDEERPDGTSVRVPESLTSNEKSVLAFAAEKYGENPENSFVPAYDLVKNWKSRENNSTVHSTIYRLIDRLDSWGYIASQWEELDPHTSGRLMRKRFIAITEAGLNRIQRELKQPTK